MEKDKDLNEEIDNALVPVKFEDSDQQIINGIVEAESKEELQAQFDLFNMNQSKKNALRMIKLEGLLNKVEDQAIERFEKRPDQVSNRELLDYMQIVSAQIDRSQRVVDSLEEKEMIRKVTPKTDVTINIGTDLDRDSKANVVGAIKGILDMLKNKNTVTAQPQYIENPVEVEEAEVIQPVTIDLQTSEDE